MPGTLFVVSTPIGNLEDITHRALRVLGEADLIACEDTRHTRKLLNHFGISTPVISYHEHTERVRAAEICGQLESGKNVALVSDAGTPAISDPGFRLISMAAGVGLEVVSVPGPSALIAALSVSGLPTDQFYFGGFLPSRANARRAALAEARSFAATLIYYEAPHRIAAALADAREILGERQAAVARELTKIHEEVARGTLTELAAAFAAAEKQRGEFVLMIDRNELPSAGTEPARQPVTGIVQRLVESGLDERTALKRAAKELGIPRSEAYRRLIAERAGRGR